MDKIKNYVIAILTGLLVLSLFTQPAQSAGTKSYDAVRLAQYSACLTINSSNYNWVGVIDYCQNYKPK
jgi:hypothetical protein